MSHPVCAALVFAFFLLLTTGAASAVLVPDPPGRPKVRTDDMLTARLAFDDMLVGKGLLSATQLDLIRTGVKTPAVVTAVRATGRQREDYREVELDLMVSRPGGRQFAAHETTLIPASALLHISPGAVIDSYHRPGDLSTVAVCVPPG